MQAQQKLFIGFCYSILYVFSTVFALFMVEKITHHNNLNPILFLWLSAIVATSLMHIIIFNKVQQIYSSIVKQKLNLLLMITSVMTIVCSSYYSAHYIGTMRYLLLYFSISGLISVLISYKHVHKTIFIISFSGFLISTICLILVILNLSQNLIHPNQIPEQRLYAVILTLAGGCASVIYAKFSQLHSVEYKLSAIETLSIRYWLVILGLPVLLPKDVLKQAVILIHSPNLVLQLLFSAILVLILPLYFSQKSLHYVKYHISIIINSLTPLAAVLVNFYMSHDLTSVNFLILALIITCSTYLMCLNLFKYPLKK